MTLLREMHRAVHANGPLTSLVGPVQQRRSSRLGNSMQLRPAWGVEEGPAKRTTSSFVERACKQWNALSDDVARVTNERRFGKLIKDTRYVH